MYAKLCNLFHVYLDKIFESIYNNTTSKNNYFINEWEERGKYIKITEPFLTKKLYSATYKHNSNRKIITTNYLNLFQ